MITADIWFDSSEDEVEANHIEVARKRRVLRDSSNPLDLPDSTFVKYFRVSKELFKFLLDKMDQKMIAPIGSASVSPVIKLSASLRFFAEGGYQKGVGNDYFAGLGQCTVSKVLSEVLDFFETEICPTKINFPTTNEEQQSIKYSFYNKTRFPGVIGCVDGTHVRIISPSKEEKHLFYNRKGFYSINVMLICDHNLMIRYVDATHPGANHDSFVWEASSIERFLRNNYENNNNSNTWLLADAGYPLKPYLITPFRNTTQDSREARFNRMHSKTRSIIERTIGVLKNSFRCILGERQMHYNKDKVTKIINTCCALHNLRREFNNNDEEQIMGGNIDVEDDDDETINDAGTRIRNQIMNSILMNEND